MWVHYRCRLIQLVLILFFVALLLTACDPVAGHYPCQLGHGWVSDDPNIVMDTWRAEDGIWHYGGEKIIMDGKEIVVQEKKSPLKCPIKWTAYSFRQRGLYERMMI